MDEKPEEKGDEEKVKGEPRKEGPKHKEMSLRELMEQQTRKLLKIKYQMS